MTVRILTGVDTLGRRYVSRRRVKPCAECGAQIPRRGTAVRFCSRACYAKSLAQKPFLNRRQRPKTGVQLSCARCQTPFARKLSHVNAGDNFCSRSCSNTAHLEAFSTRAAARPTSLELLLYDALERAGIGFERQRPISGFVVDAYVSSSRTAIEIDGEYWHSRPETIVRDRRKDAALRGRGITVVRISERAARRSIDDAIRGAGLCP